MNVTVSRRRCQHGEISFAVISSATREEYYGLVERLKASDPAPLVLSFEDGTPVWATLERRPEGIALHDVRLDSILWADRSSPFVRGELMLWEDESEAAN